MDSSSLLEYAVDKNQVPPIDQKRIVAFINHFVVNTADFLNKLAVNCETKFIDFESKLHKVEASLAILEAKLDSIPGLENVIDSNKNSTTEAPSTITPSVDTVDQPAATVANANDTNNNSESPIVSHTASTPMCGVKASEDIRYKKYFKMLQFGVPPPAVKLKMVADGLDAGLLDKPNEILADGILAEPVSED